MTVTVSDFSKITGVPRMTVYSWISRTQLPKGICVAGIGKSKILEVKESCEYYGKIKKHLSK